MYAKYDMKLFIAAVWITGLSTLAGCVSQPAAVKANLPLVSSNQLATLKQIPSTSDTKQAKAIPELKISQGRTVIDGVEYTVTSGYYSALGIQCYRLSAVQQGRLNQAGVLCKKQDYWLHFPAIASQDTQ